jgi:hypothetical protein
MAIDLARLALDAGASVDFSTAHWQSIVDSVPPAYFGALGWTPTTFGGLPAACSGTRGECIVHPLWAGLHPTILQADKDASTSGVQLQKKTLFEAVRRPF